MMTFKMLYILFLPALLFATFQQLREEQSLDGQWQIISTLQILENLAMVPVADRLFYNLIEYASTLIR
jgi:hypothetical protein